MVVVNVIEIDGSVGEGGGQVVRTSVALAALLGKDIQILNVRAKRRPPGFRPQHIVGVRAVARLSQARVEGLVMSSTKLTFKPRTRLPGEFIFEIGTAGSISLVLQALIPSTAFSPGPVKISLGGGTDVKWSPPIDYMRYVVVRVLRRLGYRANLTVVRRGHYPRGGGRVVVDVKPVRKLTPVVLTEFGEVERVRGLSHCVRLPRHVAERQANTAVKVLEEAGYGDVSVEREWYGPGEDPHLGPGSGVVLYAETTSGAVLGADALGERGKPAEVVGREAAEKLLKELISGMPVDRHMGDMLIPYMAVADGVSTVGVSEVTMHLLTNVEITELITGVKFAVDGALGEPGEIFVDGLGLVNQS